MIILFLLLGTCTVHVNVQCAHKMVSRVNDLLLWYVASGFEWLVIL